MCYRNIKGAGGFNQRSFYGKPVDAGQLNLSRPRACPGCLRERSVWWAIWDLCLVAVCPIHRCLLVDQCPSCKKTLAWQRPAVHQCPCGLDLRTLTTERADTDLVAINAVICRAAGFSPGMAAERDIEQHEFAPELVGLSLGSLLLLLRFVRSIRHKDMPNSRRRSSTRIDLTKRRNPGRPHRCCPPGKLAPPASCGAETDGPRRCWRCDRPQVSQNLWKLLLSVVSRPSPKRVRVRS